MQRRALVLGLVGIAMAILVAHSLVWNFVTDDAFISFVYSRNLARHGQLVFNLGEHVEGYTNFLWTVLLAGLMKVGLQPEIMSRVLGTACAAATLLVCALGSKWLRGDTQESAWDALPAFVLAGVPGYACWSSGGLETQLFTLLVTVGMLLYLRDHLAGVEPRPGSAVAFGLAALTRPEGILLFALTAAHRGITKLMGRKLRVERAELIWLACFVAIVVPHLLFRRWYYGWWLPNTFYIKASGGAGAFGQGAYYLSRFVLQFHLWVVPILLIGALLRRRERGLTVLAAYATLVVGAFCLYVASVGGDFMGLFRFMMPIVPLSVLCATLSLRALLEGARPGVAVAAVVLLLAGHAAHAVAVDKQSLVIGADRGIDTPGFLRWYTADRAAIGKWFGQFARPDDYAAVGGAGAQVYYSGIASLDCFGLSDEYIAHHVRAVSTRPGHQKYAPVEYQLAKKPTIITSNYYRLASSPWVGPDQDWWQKRGYHYVSVQVPGLSSPWYAFLLRNDRSFGPLPKLDAAAGTEREP
jgi:hypothetical protein